MSDSGSSKPVAIVGAGRHGRNVAGLLAIDTRGLTIAGYLDDTKAAGETVDGYPVLGDLARMNEHDFVARHAWIVAIGDNAARQRLSLALGRQGAELVNAIHRAAIVSDYAKLGRGIFVNAFVRIGSGSRIGDWALIEGLTWVGCDVMFGEAARTGPGAVLAADAVIGARTFLGAGVVVSNAVRIGADCVVAANGAVIRDLPDGVRAQGLPARPVSGG
jgi:sugar O-acyltransferase (sialic acid O-acetyltransferase NeuD family)